MKNTIALVCALALCAPVFADVPAVTVPAVAVTPTPTPAAPTKESIDKLLEAMNVENMVTSIQARANNAVKAGMQNALRGQVTTPEQEKIMDDLAKKISTDIGTELSWANMKPLYTQVYSETFTQQEIDGLVQFYESPTGKVFVSKVPQVMDKTMALMQARIGPLMRNLQKSIMDSAKEIRALKPTPTPVTMTPATPAPVTPTIAPAPVAPSKS
jgi:hypothetical protein